MSEPLAALSRILVVPSAWPTKNVPALLKTMDSLWLLASSVTNGFGVTRLPLEENFVIELPTKFVE